MEQMNRRDFLGTTAAGTLALNGLLHHASAADQAKLKFGLIGCGNYGMTDTKAAFKAGGVEMVALCDVDSQHLTETATALEKMQGTRPKTFKHYQELLATPGLQAVIIATPPHWHALPFLAAVEKNLDIYCEKPLAYDIREAQAMVAAAKKKDIVVQIGFQRRQSPALRQVRDYLQQGSLGRIVQVDAQIHYLAGPRDATPQDPPASLDWDLWCGPAPKIPYSPQVGHYTWRLEKTTGHGHLVDWGIHLIDATRWILGLTMPRSVQAAGGLYYYKDKITTPGRPHRPLRFRRLPGRLEASHLGRPGVHAGSVERHLLLRRERHGLRDRRPLGRDSEGQEQAAGRAQGHRRHGHRPHDRVPQRRPQPPAAGLHD